MCGGARAYLNQWGIALADPDLEPRGGGGEEGVRHWIGMRVTSTNLFSNMAEIKAEISAEIDRPMAPSWIGWLGPKPKRDMSRQINRLVCNRLMSWEILTRCKNLQFYDKKCTAALVGGSLKRNMFACATGETFNNPKDYPQTQIIFDLLWLLEITLADNITLLTIPGAKPVFFFVFFSFKMLKKTSEEHFSISMSLGSLRTRGSNL